MKSYFSIGAFAAVVAVAVVMLITATVTTLASKVQMDPEQVAIQFSRQNRPKLMAANDEAQMAIAFSRQNKMLVAAETPQLAISFSRQNRPKLVAGVSPVTCGNVKCVERRGPFAPISYATG